MLQSRWIWNCQCVSNLEIALPWALSPSSWSFAFPCHRIHSLPQRQTTTPSSFPRSPISLSLSLSARVSPARRLVDVSATRPCRSRCLVPADGKKRAGGGHCLSIVHSPLIAHSTQPHSTFPGGRMGDCLGMGTWITSDSALPAPTPHSLLHLQSPSAGGLSLSRQVGKGGEPMAEWHGRRSNLYSPEYAVLIDRDNVTVTR